MQGKAIAWIGAVVGIISAIGVLYGIFHHPDTSVANYQKQVRPTCDRVHATLTADHGLQIMKFNPNASFGDPQSEFLVDKAGLLQVARSNYADVKSEFQVLQARLTPKALRSQKAKFDAAERDWEAYEESSILLIETKVRDGMTLGELNAIAPDSTPETARIRSEVSGALTELAGGECTAVP
jgi:hypothetical protein